MVWNDNGLIWNPLFGLQRLQDEFGSLFRRLDPSGSGADGPPANVWSDENGLVLTMELPGCAAGDVDITVEGDTLTLASVSAEQTEPERDGFYRRRERPSGPFRRSFRLPFAVRPDRVEASLSRGVLEVRLPRPEEQKPRKIHVQAQ